MNTVWNNVELALPSIWYRNRKIQFENGIKWIRYASWIGFNTALCIYTLTRYHFKRRVQISRYKYIPHFMLVHKSWSLCTILLANSFLPTFTDTRRMNILCTSENHEIFSSCFSENDSEIELKHCKSSRPDTVNSSREYLVHLNWIFKAHSSQWLDSSTGRVEDRCSRRCEFKSRSSQQYFSRR